MAHRSTHKEDSIKDIRDQNKEIDNLRELLPIPKAVSQKMDRATVVRTVTGFLRLRSLDWPEDKPTLPAKNKAMEMFCFILDKDGNFIYATENMSTTIGYQQNQLFGMPFFELLHPYDRELFHSSLSKPEEDEERCIKLTIRMLTKQSKRTMGFAIKDGDSYYKGACLEVFVSQNNNETSIVGNGTVLDRNGYPDMLLLTDQCVFYCSVDLTLFHVAPPENQFLGKPWIQLYNSSLYQYIHPEDIQKVAEFHRTITKSTNFEADTQCIRMIGSDNSNSYVTFHFIFRNSMKREKNLENPSSRDDETIKILVTNYGNENPQHSHTESTSQFSSLTFNSITNFNWVQGESFLPYSSLSTQVLDLSLPNQPTYPQAQNTLPISHIVPGLPAYNLVNPCLTHHSTLNLLGVIGQRTVQTDLKRNQLNAGDKPSKRK